MNGFCPEAVRCRLQRWQGGTGRLVSYWLSLWRDGRLPLRADFHPRAVVDLLPSICIFDVVPDKSVHCRLIGSRLVEAANGYDITGQDWLALSKPEDRPVRLRRFSDVARGAVGRGIREAQRASGEAQFAEEVMLPFHGTSEDGARQVLTHIAWSNSLYDPTLTGLARNRGVLIDFELIPLDA